MALFTPRQFSSHRYAQKLADQFGESNQPLAPLPEPQYDSVNGSVVLHNLTELTYTVPPNTSLINITGPVYPVSDADARCYALLSPDPWWVGTFVPEAQQGKPEYRENQTLILLPVDPTVQYELVIGAFAPECAISGVTTYSYLE